MLDIVNYGMIEHPNQAIRIIIGNIEGTNDIYMKRESLQIDEETRRTTSAIRYGGGAPLGQMVWTEECSKIFTNIFRLAKFYYKSSDGETAWDEAYIRFIKYLLSSNCLNYDQFLPFIAGMKVFETELAKGTKVFINKYDYVPYSIVEKTSAHYVMKNESDESKTVEVMKDELEKIALEKWQLEYRKMYPEYF
jgi:hypothetical protein